MPITENKFTAEELKAAVEANKELLPIVTGFLTTDQKMIVRTPAEEATFKTNFEATIAADLTKNHAEKLEADVKALTGIDKVDANEKYYDYFKRATKKALESVTTLQNELAELRGKANLTDAEKARIKQLEKGIEDKETEWKTKYSELEKTHKRTQAEAVVKADAAKLRSKFKADLPASVIEILEKTAVDDLVNNSTVAEDGTLIFLDAEKKPINDPTTFKPKTAEAILADKHFKDIIDTGKKVEGPGTGTGTQGQQGQQGGGGAAFTWGGVPAGVKSQRGVTDHLLKAGVLQDSKEWMEVFSKPEVTALPVRDPA
jgi:hypothetical protein